MLLLLMLVTADGTEGFFTHPALKPSLPPHAFRGLVNLPDARAFSLGDSPSLCFFLQLASSGVGASEAGPAGVGVALRGARVEALELGAEAGAELAPNGMTSLPACNFNCTASIIGMLLLLTQQFISSYHNKFKYSLSLSHAHSHTHRHKHTHSQRDRREREERKRKLQTCITDAVTVLLAM